MLSIGRYLLRLLGKRGTGSFSRVRLWDERLPEPPSPRELAALAAAASGETGKARDQLALGLMSIDSTNRADLQQAAETVLSEMDPKAWMALDVAARKSWYMAPSWSIVLRNRLGKGQASVLRLVLASFHDDGHIREAAVTAMSERGSLVAIRALSLRCGDWVEEVRERARTAVEARLASDHDVFVEVAPLALAMNERRLGAWLAERIGRDFHAADKGKLRGAMKSRDWRTRRLAFVTAIDRSLMSFPELIDVALQEADLPTRSRATEAAVAIARTRGAVPDLKPLLASHTASVRGEAVSALAKVGDIDPAFSALTDTSSMVRWLAQAAVRHSGADPAQRYRALVAQDPPPPPVLVGLGETGSSSDVSLVMPWLHHPQAKGRAAAIRALCLLGEATPERLSGLLEDTSAAVTRQAAVALAGRAKEVDRELLRRLVDPHRPRHVRLAAFRLLRERDVWTRLATDLQFVDDPEMAISQRARTDLEMWLRRDAATTYARPSGADAQSLRELLDQAERSLNPDRAKLLRFHLGLQRSATS